MIHMQRGRVCERERLDEIKKMQAVSVCFIERDREVESFYIFTRLSKRG